MRRFNETKCSIQPVDERISAAENTEQSNNNYLFYEWLMIIFIHNFFPFIFGVIS